MCNAHPFLFITLTLFLHRSCSFGFEDGICLTFLKFKNVGVYTERGLLY